MGYVDEHVRDLSAPADVAWQRVAAMGGDERRYTPHALWRVRGFLDRAVGGPGFRLTGPERPPAPGDIVDFWTVEAAEPPLLRLRAQTRLPGAAYLELEVEPRGEGSRLVVRTLFEPAGLPGHAYWWAQLGAHKVVFAMMADRLASLVDADPA